MTGDSSTGWNPARVTASDTASRAYGNRMFGQPIIITGSKHPLYINILGAIALFASMTNIVSGFLITDRMLKMFKKKEDPKS